MKEFLHKHFQGSYHIKFGDYFLNFPKLAPLMIVAMLLSTIGELNNHWSKYVGWGLIALGVYCFFLPKKEENNNQKS